MPELPEVQTTANDLDKKVKGRRIVDVWQNWPKLKPIEKATGRKIENIKRLGKNILFYLDQNNILLVHQKMTGHLLVGKWQIQGKKAIPLEPSALKEKVNGYIHFLLALDNGLMVGFSDLRKFGKVAFGTAEEIMNLKEIKQLGPDALRVGFDEFARRITKRNKTIYQILMDQTVVSGIGNIYASEILWLAKIYPFKTGSELNSAELKNLYKAVSSVLKKALGLRGTSTADYRDTAGAKGKYGETRYVYQREGEGCSRCGTAIKRAKKGGRSAHYCPKCQK